MDVRFGEFRGGGGGVLVQGGELGEGEGHVMGKEDKANFKYLNPRLKLGDPGQRNNTWVELEVKGWTQMRRR